jgi:hypothetical protein
MRRGLWVLLIALLLTFSGGCAVFHPYVRPDSAKRSDESLAAAIEYATAAKDRYMAAQNAYAGTATIIPYVALPLAAAGLGLGMTGGSTVAITALGLATGTSVAAGVWVQNKPREMAYNLGYQAVNCLLQSVEPFQAAATRDFHDAVFGDGTISPRKRSLAEARANLQGEIARLRGLIGADPVLTAYANEADKLYKETAPIQAAGEQLAGAASGVARNLVNNVDAVVGKINNAIRETTPNVQAISATIAGLSVLQPASMPSPPTPKSPSLDRVQQVPVSSEVNQALAAVVDAVERVAALATTVNAAIIKSQKTQDVPTLASCLQIPDSFSVVVRPAESSITMKQGITRRVAFSGGKGPYFATVATGPKNTSDLTTSAKMDGGYFVEVVVSKTCPTTTNDQPYKIHISDALGTGGDIAVTVEAAPPELTAKPGEIQIDATKDQTIAVVLTGGKAPYRAVVSGAANVTANAAAGKTDTFDVTVKKNATEGSVVFIDDSHPPLRADVPIKK